MVKTEGYVGSLAILVTNIPKSRKLRKKEIPNNPKHGEAVIESRSGSKYKENSSKERQKKKSGTKGKEKVERRKECPDEKKEIKSQDRENREKEIEKGGKSTYDFYGESLSDHVRTNKFSKSTQHRNQISIDDGEKEDTMTRHRASEFQNMSTNSNDHMTFEEEIMSYAREELAFKESLLDERRSNDEEYSLRESIGLSINIVQQMKSARSCIDLLVASNSEDEDNE